MSAGDVLVNMGGAAVAPDTPPKAFMGLMSSPVATKRPTTASFKIGEAPAAAAAAAAAPAPAAVPLAAGQKDVTFAANTKMGINWDRAQIVRVSSVAADGQAATLGVTAGDVLVSVNGAAVAASIKPNNFIGLLTTGTDTARVLRFTIAPPPELSSKDKAVVRDYVSLSLIHI